MSKVMLALTIALFLWPCTTLPASAAWRICGSLYNAFCVVDEASSHPCALALTERGGPTWPDKWAACRATKLNVLTGQCRAAVSEVRPPQLAASLVDQFLSTTSAPCRSVILSLRPSPACCSIGCPRNGEMRPSSPSVRPPRSSPMKRCHPPPRKDAFSFTR